MVRLFVLLLSLLPLSVTAQTTAEPVSCRNCAVVLDIDGTLTPNVYAIWQTRRDAVHAVQAYADRGVFVIYLSARIPLFQRRVEPWLSENNFPQGKLHLALSDADRDDEQAFKARILQDYQADGWRIIAAYGDSTSDFDAYADAGLSRDIVFALRREGQDACQPGPWALCLDGWTDQLDRITQDLDALQ